MDNNKELNGLKITYVSQAPVDRVGVGGAARVKSMVSIFKKLGLEINLISYSILSDKFGIEHKKIDQSLQTTTVNMRSSLPKFLKGLALFPIFLYTWKSCKNCDLVFADSTNVVTSLPVVILGKMFRKPIIVDYIDLETVKLPNFIYRYIKKNADVVFAISQRLLESAKVEYGCKNVAYVPIVVDTNQFKMYRKDRERIREALGINKGETVIGYAGSFWYVEGVPILLKAFENLKNRYSSIKLAIMGKKYMSGHDDIPKLVADMNLENEVILIPSQPHEDVPKFLSAFDILCCPKIDCEINRASNPVKIPEYLSMGLPTVCSSFDWITNIIEDGVNGFLVKAGDVKDLEEKLEWIILNPERAREIGEKGRMTAIEEYSLGTIENTIRQSVTEAIVQKG